MNLQNLSNLLPLLQQAQSRQATPPIVEFRAGLLKLTGTTVKADKRRGRLTLVKEDNVPHLKWFTRPEGKQEIDMTLFPGSAKFEKVPECKSGRVFLLRMKANNAKHFFWMQEPKDDKDDEYLKTLNETIQAATATGSTAAPDSDASSSASAASATGAAATSPANTTTTTTPAAGSDAASSSSSASPAGAASASSAAPPTADITDTNAAIIASLQNMAAQMQRRPRHNLGEILDAQRVMAHLDSSDMKRLEEFLPETQRGEAEVKAQLRCPQLRQTVGRLSALLNSEQYGEIMTSVGLPVTGDLGVGAFVNAIQKQADDAKKQDDA